MVKLRPCPPPKKTKEHVYKIKRPFLPWLVKVDKNRIAQYQTFFTSEDNFKYQHIRLNEPEFISARFIEYAKINGKYVKYLTTSINDYLTEAMSLGDLKFENIENGDKKEIRITISNIKIKEVFISMHFDTIDLDIKNALSNLIDNINNMIESNKNLNSGPGNGMDNGMDNGSGMDGFGTNLASNIELNNENGIITGGGGSSGDYKRKKYYDNGY